jgi:hypothetical protein
MDTLHQNMLAFLCSTAVYLSINLMVLGIIKSDWRWLNSYTMHTFSNLFIFQLWLSVYQSFISIELPDPKVNVILCWRNSSCREVQFLPQYSPVRHSHQVRTSPWRDHLSSGWSPRCVSKLVLQLQRSEHSSWLHSQK